MLSPRRLALKDKTHAQGLILQIGTPETRVNTRLAGRPSGNARFTRVAGQAAAGRIMGQARDCQSAERNDSSAWSPRLLGVPAGSPLQPLSIGRLPASKPEVPVNIGLADRHAGNPGKHWAGG